MRGAGDDCDACVWEVRRSYIGVSKERSPFSARHVVEPDETKGHSNAVACATAGLTTLQPRFVRVAALGPDAFAWYAVDRAIGNVRNQGPELVEPIKI